MSQPNPVVLAGPRSPWGSLRNRRDLGLGVPKTKVETTHRNSFTVSLGVGGVDILPRPLPRTSLYSVRLPDERWSGTNPSSRETPPRSDGETGLTFGGRARKEGLGV